MGMCPRHGHLPGLAAWVAALLRPFIKNILDSVDVQSMLPLFNSDLAREHAFREWERRSSAALREMYENKARIDFEYVDDGRLGHALDIDLE